MSGSPLILRIGTIEIQVRAEPLQEIVANTDLDAIVSSDDSTLSMAGGVSAAIASLTGSVIRDEVASRLPLPVGAIAVTSAGMLPIKYVIHAVTVDWANRVLPTPRTIRQLIREILSRCEALNIARVAIPALATGAAQMSATVSAEILARAIKEHAVNPTALKCVVLPIPNREVYHAFARELAAPLGDEITSVPTMMAGSSAHEVSGDLAGTIRGIPRLPHDAGFHTPPPKAPRAKRFRSWLARSRSSPSLADTQDLVSTRPPPVDAAVTERRRLLLSTESDSSRPMLAGRYVLLEEIGRGGMAIVYLCWDLVLRRAVAVKILRPDCADPQSLKREAATAFQLTHDGIVRLYHFEPARLGTEAYIVMEYLTWPSGEKWIADAGVGGLPVRAVQDVGVRMCDALEYAHGRSVLHLDIKPSNIFVDPAGEFAKLGDFGLACFSSSAGAALQVKPMGTPAYMAPEQKTLGARVSAATDVYQMAATLWDFVTGSPPKSLRLDLDRFGSDRTRFLSLLSEALAPDPGVRPTAMQLRHMLTGNAT
jgi:O-acetyl-ADP-ribose deacetylase (regulator of RNase III)